MPDPQADTKEFMGFLMYDIQETWMEYFADNGLQYQETTMVIFTGSVSTGCGNATSAVGSLLLSGTGRQQGLHRFRLLRRACPPVRCPRLAQAYVIAHEIGHHIQSITGYSDAVRQATQQNLNLKNELSVRQELQADCFAGVWAHSAAERTTSAGLPIIAAPTSTRDWRCRRRWRRPDPGAGRHVGRSTRLDPRLGRGPPAMVHCRPRHRRPRPVQHLRGRSERGRPLSARCLANSSVGDFSRSPACCHCRRP
ncbi:MAG: neutral zinc metallopeptidase [Acidimicrobiales bacterium]